MTNSSSLVSFADVAHQTLSFDRENSAIVLELIDTAWVQRLRNISQTGNTKLVYMFAEHSRFGHCLGVAYLANLLMANLKKFQEASVLEYENAVAAAAILHDIGHIAPGSHLAEKIWSKEEGALHEQATQRIILEDPEIVGILQKFDKNLPDTVCKILRGDSSVPAWTKSIISGGGWNADRGNWAIVDSAMCAVTYGRYNVVALIDAFRLDHNLNLVLGENRVDALTHFFVARDSMYRQVYQHRVLQAADALTGKIVQRLKDLVSEDIKQAENTLKKSNIYFDQALITALTSKNYAKELSLQNLFEMTEHWWSYHLNKWTYSSDSILKDLSLRLRDRKLFKTIRLESSKDQIVEKAKTVSKELGFDPNYYVCLIEEKDKHRGKKEETPKVILDSGNIVNATEVDPTIDAIMSRKPAERAWLSVPKEVKAALGRAR